MKLKMILIVLITMTFLMITACTASNDEITKNTTVPAVESETNEDISNGTNIEQQLKELDYNGIEFRVLGFEYRDVYGDDEINWEAESGEPLQDAIYMRNRLTEDLLNIVITPTYGNVSGMLKNSVLANDDEYDTIFNVVTYNYSSALSGYMLNLNNIDSLNLENPWWDHNIIEKMSIYNKLYFLCGDINYYDDYAKTVIFFNKACYDDLNMKYPYQDVLDGSWTFDKLIEASSKFTRDVNGDEKMSLEDDNWGFSSNNSCLISFMYGFGDTYTAPGIDNELEIALGSETNVTHIDKIFNFLNTIDKKIFYDSMEYIFIDGRNLFYCNALGDISQFRTMEDDFGITPFPKYDEAQESYHSMVSLAGWATSYSIPLTAQNLELTGSALEAMSAYSADYVTTVLYEKLLNVKYVRDDETVQTLKLIFNSGAYEFSLGFDWSSDISTLLCSLVQSNTNTYVSSMQKVLEKSQTKLDKMLQTISSLPE